MSSLKKLSGLIAVIVVIVFASFTGKAAAAGAFVVNHGNNPGDTCSLSYAGYTLTGWVGLVLTPSGNTHLGCALSGGPALDRPVMIVSGGEMLLLTPGGTGTLIFNG